MTLANRTALERLPKIDLHRHLEGSLRLTTLAEIAARYRLDLPREAQTLRPLVQMTPSDPHTPRAFLDKFNVLRRFYLSPGIIRRLAFEAVEDAARDGVRYLELRFTPAALARTQGFSLRDVMSWVSAGAEDARRQYPEIELTLIASVNRHEPIEMAEQVVALVTDRQRDIVAIDLAGDEANYPAEPFAGLFAEARRSGLGVTSHAGEWSGPASVRHAIERLGVKRIGHGVRVIEDPAVVALAREHDVVFEVSLTSNLDTGVATGLTLHPLPLMLAAGLRVTLNTDDPGISNCTLTSELTQALSLPGITEETLHHMAAEAVQAAFQPDVARHAMGMLQPA